MNVSSVVVKAMPENLNDVLKSLSSSGLCEVHFHDEMGRIVVTIEGESLGEEVSKMKAIMNIPNVVCADLAYSYSEEELHDALLHLRKMET
ncbi:MAG: chaperone NapD [Nitrospirae bacterium]|nr:chaperone NapD [Nitrospirota bacterium]MDA8214453.1 chaperone NapD [Nitrospiraceae bacterium]